MSKYSAPESYTNWTVGTLREVLSDFNVPDDAPVFISGPDEDHPWEIANYDAEKGLFLG